MAPAERLPEGRKRERQAVHHEHGDGGIGERAIAEPEQRADE